MVDGPRTVGEGVRQDRPPGWTLPPAVVARCSACGNCGADRAGVADLEVTWLLRDPTRTPEQVTTRRFCRGCRPSGAVAELACAGCGDGPLLAGALADADLAASAAIDAWLIATGWRLALTGRAGPWCPACAAVVYPRRTRGGTEGQAGVVAQRGRR